jgi:hypothetical protein
VRIGWRQENVVARAAAQGALYTSRGTIFSRTSQLGNLDVWRTPMKPLRLL